MSARHRRTIALVSLALAASATAGCGQSSPDRPGAAPAASAKPSAAATPITGDVRACLGVEAVLGHVAAGTARWSPQRRPFDKAIAARLRTSSDQLAKQGPQAQSTQVRKAVNGIAVSFGSLSDAMAKRNRAEFTSAMAQTKATYKVLKATCQLD